MNFKRILAGVMAGATAISLAACSNSGNGGFDSTATSDTSSTGTTIDDEKENPVSVGDISLKQVKMLSLQSFSISAATI